MVLNDEPYLAPTLEQEIYAPPEWNLGKRSRSSGTAMASLVGLKVEPLGPKQEWFQGLIVCILLWISKAYPGIWNLIFLWKIWFKVFKWLWIAVSKMFHSAPSSIRLARATCWLWTCGWYFSTMAFDVFWCFLHLPSIMLVLPLRESTRNLLLGPKHAPHGNHVNISPKVTWFRYNACHACLHVIQCIPQPRKDRLQMVTIYWIDWNPQNISKSSDHHQRV